MILKKTPSFIPRACSKPALHVLCAIIFSAAGLQGQTPAATDYEMPPSLPAAEILRPEIFSSAYHSVRPLVPSYAGHNHYMIDSQFGIFEVEGNQMLTERVAEIHALAALRELSKTDRYREALEAAMRSPVQLAGNLIKDPVNTVTGVPKGVWKFMNRAGQSIKEAGHQRPPNPYEDSAVEGMIGYSKVKRDIAATLGVDPYSSNPVLQQELNSAAWVSFGGKMTFSAALMPVGGAAGMVASGLQVSNASIQAVTDFSAQDLRLRNTGLLTEMGIPKAAAEDFLELVTAFSPTRSTLLVEALGQMNGVAGRELFLQSSRAATHEIDAIFFQRSAQALARMHATTPLEKIGLFRGFPFGVAQDGSIILAIEWDHAVWTPQVDNFLTALLAGVDYAGPKHRLTVAITGTASPRLRTEFAARGYQLVEKCLPGPLAD